MIKLDPNKLSKLKTASQLLDEKYGKPNTQERLAFDAESFAWYFGEILKERRETLNISQEDLAKKINNTPSYISEIEDGKADIGMFSFLKLSNILGISYAPVFG